jgi:hypothetical protein
MHNVALQESTKSRRPYYDLPARMTIVHKLKRFAKLEDLLMRSKTSAGKSERKGARMA